MVDALPLAEIVCDVCGRSTMLTSLQKSKWIDGLKSMLSMHTGFIGPDGRYFGFPSYVSRETCVYLDPPCGCGIQGFPRRLESQVRTKSLARMMVIYVASRPVAFPESKLLGNLPPELFVEVKEQRTRLQEISCITRIPGEKDSILDNAPKPKAKRAKTVPR